jgi:hypothetical protein
MKRNIGRFQAVPYQMGGEVEEPVMPPQAPSNSPMQKSKNPQIMGAPMADPGMKKGIMGQISAPKERLTPQSYAGEMAAQKRMKQAPTQSPLGPITGGLKSMGQGMKPQQPAANQPSMGDEWMGEVWQKLTPDEMPGMQQEVARGVGYANGGSVQEASDVYMNAIRDLSYGGVAGYAHGGMVDQSNQIASMGRNGDSMLMHVNPAELQGLQSLLGPMTVNPETGNPEAFAWFLPLLGLAAGTVASGAASDWEAGPMVLGALTGAGLGAGIGSLGATSGTVAGTTAAANSGVVPAATNPLISPWLPTSLQAPMNISGPIPLASTLQAANAAPTVAQTLGAGAANLAPPAPGAGVLLPEFGGGLTEAQVAAAGFGPEAGGIYSAGSSPIDAGKIDKAMKIMGQGQSMAGGQPSQPRPKTPSFPETRMASRQGPNPLPGEELRKRRMNSGIRTPGMSRIGGSRNV